MVSTVSEIIKTQRSIVNPQINTTNAKDNEQIVHRDRSSIFQIIVHHILDNNLLYSRRYPIPRNFRIVSSKHEASKRRLPAKNCHKMTKALTVSSLFCTGKGRRKVRPCVVMGSRRGESGAESGVIDCART